MSSSGTTTNRRRTRLSNKNQSSEKNDNNNDDSNTSAEERMKATLDVLNREEEHAVAELKALLAMEKTLLADQAKLKQAQSDIVAKRDGAAF